MCKKEKTKRRKILKEHHTFLHASAIRINFLNTKARWRETHTHTHTHKKEKEREKKEKEREKKEKVSRQ